MFVVRIAGDVGGDKRNIEVTFPRRPTLQEICTVAETILPLRRSSARSPWRPPGPLAGSALLPAHSSSVLLGSSAATPDHGSRAPPLADYVVESLAYVNPATGDWEELRSAAQLTFGTQVYCFCPLQHHRVAMVQSSSSAIKQLPLPRESWSLFPPPSLEALPIVREVRDQWVNADRPGAIPAPQQRLVWDCTTAHADATTPMASWSRSAVDSRDVASAREDASPNNSRNLSRASGHRAAHVPSPRQSQVVSPRNASHSPSVAFPHYVFPVSPDAPSCERSALSSRQPYNINSGGPSGVSLNHSSPLFRSSCLSKLVDADVGDRSAPAPLHFLRNSGSSFIVEGERSGSRPSLIRASMACEETPALTGDAARFFAALQQLQTNGSSRYAHLGERLALLFDVLVHLDAEGRGCGVPDRHFLLLRDFYLLATSLTSSGANAVGGSRSMALPHVMDLTTELANRFGWSWDDLLRSADKDRDGCIAYREWIAFGIEHPDVIQLLSEGVCALPASVKSRLWRQSQLRSPSAASDSPVSPSPLQQQQGQPPPNPQSSSSTVLHSDPCLDSGAYPCRIHSCTSTDGIREQHNLGVLNEAGGRRWIRCEACRELAAQSPEERQRWAAKIPPFAKVLREPL